MSQPSFIKRGAPKRCGQLTYVGVVREAETVEVRDPEVRALGLHPRVGSSLTPQLLVDSAGVPRLCELVWHRAAHHELGRHRGGVGGAGVRMADLDGDTHVEAASDPLAGLFHDDDGATSTAAET